MIRAQVCRWAQRQRHRGDALRLIPVVRVLGEELRGLERADLGKMTVIIEGQIGGTATRDSGARPSDIQLVPDAIA